MFDTKDYVYVYVCVHVYVCIIMETALEEYAAKYNIANLGGNGGGD